MRTYEVHYQGRPPKSGYVPVSEDGFVHRLLDVAIRKALAADAPYAVELYERVRR
ncbi:hypothetical protein [Streptomyces roseolus]|uniref:hypothetical protein n=1 Tax=Streptomyces roseolus TaxID=67358 RepID=UPI00365EAF8F